MKKNANETPEKETTAKSHFPNPNKIRSIGVLCSGGDSPGMNAALRAVVRTTIASGLTSYGIQRGFAGLLEGNIRKLEASSVGNIIQHGGTILQTSRCKEFFDPAIRTEAAHILKRKGIDALVVIGGNGSFNGCYLLNKEHNVPIIGIPGTIDNDVAGTSYTIGFDTAVQTAMEAVDKIRDTASSHERTFIVEVMGRRSPAIAQLVGICTGAENIVFPDQGEPDYQALAQDITRGVKRGKNSSIIVVAEGEEQGLCYKIQQNLKEKYSLESHVCILGHVQRGGRPTPLDRYRASRMGYASVEALLKGEVAMVTAHNQGELELVPLEKCIGKKEHNLGEFMKMVHTLAI